jgi:hypothetical protein
LGVFVGCSSIINHIIILHEDISKIPSILLNFLRLENTKVTLGLQAAQVLARDQKFTEIDGDLILDGVVTKSENLLAHIKERSNMIAAMFKVTSSPS